MERVKKMISGCSVLKYCIRRFFYTKRRLATISPKEYPCNPLQTKIIYWFLSLCIQKKLLNLRVIYRMASLIKKL
jgi:hypothetical protein